VYKHLALFYDSPVVKLARVKKWNQISLRFLGFMECKKTKEDEDDSCGIVLAVEYSQVMYDLGKPLYSYLLGVI